MRLRVATSKFWIALATLALACGGGGGSPTEPPPPPPPPGGNVVTVRIVDSAFNPSSVTVEPGDTVRWVLDGGMTNHTTTEVNGVWDSGFVFTQPGATFDRTFPMGENGQTFAYSCLTHDACCDMRGSIRVGSTAPPPPPGYE